MGKYADSIKASRQHMSPQKIAEEKNARCRARNAQRRKEVQEEVSERLLHWQSLSLEQQLEQLDARLGKDVGAVKQRARILHSIADRANKAIANDEARRAKKKKKKKK
jgi:hypothetical protein